MELKNLFSKDKIDNVKEYTDVVLKGVEATSKLISEVDKLNTKNNALSKSTEDNTKKKKELTEQDIELNRIITQSEKIAAKREAAELGLTDALVKEQLELQKIQKTIKDKAQAEEKATKQAELSVIALNKQRQSALKQVAKQEQAEKDLRKALELEVKSEEDAIAQNKALRAARRKLDATTQDGIEQVEAFNERINKNSEFLAGNADAATAAKDNVGKYQEGIEAALASSDKFSGGTTNVISNFVEISQSEGGISSFFKTFVGGIGAATKAGLKFILTPIGAVIALIVVGIGLFTAAVSRNESASDGFQKVWAGISTVIDELIGRFFKFAGAIGKFFSGDFTGAANDLSKAFTGLGDSISKAFEEGQKLFDLQIKLKESTISSTTELAKLNAESEKQNAISDDATRSFKEREEASEKARIAEEKAGKLRVDLAKQQSSIIDIQVAQAIRQGTINRTLRQEQADANAELIDAESAFTIAVLNNNKTRSELKQDRLEKDLDILIDGFDNQKTINERLIADDKRTLDERSKLLEETRVLAESSFNNQISIIEKFTDVSVNANELVATSDAVVLNEKIRSLGLSEIIEGRLLEIIRERRIATQDLNEAEIEIVNKRNAELVSLEKSSVDLTKDRNSKIFDSNKKLEDSLIQNTIDGAAQRKAIADQEAQDRIDNQKFITDKTIDLAAQAAQGISDVLFEGAAQRRDEELELLDEKREEDLERVDTETEEDLLKVQDKFDRGLITEDQAAAQRTAINEKSAAEKIRIDEEVNKKEAAIKTKQAKADKVASLINVAINTAVGISKTIAQLGFPAAIPAIIAVAAAGAIQTAVIAATPIPKFKDGTHGKFNTPDSFIAGEAGKEIIARPDGSMFVTPNKATMYSDMAGSQVIPNKEAMSMLDGLGIGYSSNFSDMNIVNELKNTNRLLKRNTTASQKDDIETKRSRRMTKRNHSRREQMRS